MGVAAIAALTAQALTSSFAESGYSPAVASRRLLLKVTNSGVERVRQRAVLTPFDTAPLQTSYVEHDWVNGDTVLTVGASNQFQSVQVGAGALDPVDFYVRPLGLEIRDRKLYGGGYTIGLRHYFEEGVIRIDDPLGSCYTCHHDSALPRGRLFFRPDGQIEWQQESGGVLVQRILEGVTFPHADVAPGGEDPQWFYFHLTREWSEGSPGTHAINLTINTTAADEELITGTQNPIETGTVGWRTADGIPERFTAAWMRAGWSDPALTGAWGTDPWSSPVLFQPITVDAHGEYSAGWIDGGAADRYWRELTFVGLNRTYGEKLEVRAVALNAPPNGSLAGIWDSKSWITVGSNLRASLYQSSAYPQGRYLLLQFRLTPSPTVPLGGAPLIFQVNGAGTVLTAEAWDTEPPVPGGALVFTPFPIDNSEGTATATLPQPVEMPLETVHARAVLEFPTERGSTRSRPTETRGRRRFRSSGWVVTTDERDVLEAFFEARAGGAEPFFWPQPDGTTVTVKLLNDVVDWQWLGPDAWRSREPLELVEVFG